VAGGASWGEVIFDGNGRRAEYANDAGGASGRILLTGLLGGSNNYSGATRSIVMDPILIGEWRQNDGHGALILKFESRQLRLLWGPRFLRESVWSAHSGAVGIAKPPAGSAQSGCDGVEVSLATGGTQCIKPGLGQSFRDCLDCPVMVVVPAGSFMMGSPDIETGRSDDEGPHHMVTISKPLAVGKFEITFAEWDVCVRESGCKHKPGDEGWGRGDRPVINVSWTDIIEEYLPWLSRKTGRTYRLLTEAEWEYAARAGTTGPFSFSGPIATNKANYSEGRLNTVSVGSSDPNLWGLHHVHGNAWEWTQDCWNDKYDAAPSDGSAWERGGCGKRVVRGGSWYNRPEDLRAANRYSESRNLRDNTTGFRVARTLSP
jgi:formylglycine-generating enzyme required for sulfatase activity